MRCCFLVIYVFVYAFFYPAKCEISNLLLYWGMYGIQKVINADQISIKKPIFK